MINSIPSIQKCTAREIRYEIEYGGNENLANTKLRNVVRFQKLSHFVPQQKLTLEASNRRETRSSALFYINVCSILDYKLNFIPSLFCLYSTKMSMFSWKIGSKQSSIRLEIDCSRRIVVKLNGNEK